MKRSERAAAVDSVAGEPRACYQRTWSELFPTDARMRAAAVVAGLLLAVAFIYAPVRNFEFTNLDDFEYVPENPHVNTGLSLENVGWALTSGYAANWFPLTWMSLMLDVELFGVNSGASHLVNVALHAASAALLFLILYMMTGTMWRSAFAAAMFALHPLRVESVAWVAERKDTLSTLLWILTLGAYILYLRRPSKGHYTAMLICFILGLMSKPMLVTLPFVLLLLDVWPLRRISFDSAPGLRNLRLAVIEKLPMLAIVIASSTITYLVQSRGGAVSMTADFPLAMRVMNGIVGYVRYIGKLFWPADLAVFYPFDESIPAWQVVGSLALLVGISLGVLVKIKTMPQLAVGWFIYVGTLVPVIGLIKIGSHSIADRYTYIPHIGLLLMIGWGAPRLFEKLGLPRQLIAVLALTCLLIFTVLSRRQVSSWQNSFVMWSHAARVVENNAEAHSILGTLLVDQGRRQEAIAEFETALRMNPKLVHALSNYGAELLRQGQTERALQHLQRAVALNPNVSDAHSNLGAALAAGGDHTQAIAHFEKAIQLNPSNADTYINWGIALSGMGDVRGAIDKFRAAVGRRPHSPEANNNLGAALARTGNLPEAARYMTEALRLKPQQPDWLVNLAVVLLQQGDHVQAAQYAQQALELAPGNPRAQAVLQQAAAVQQ